MKNWGGCMGKHYNCFCCLLIGVQIKNYILNKFSDSGRSPSIFSTHSNLLPPKKSMLKVQWPHDKAGCESH